MTLRAVSITLLLPGVVWGQPVPPAAWQSTLQTDHELVGRIWSNAEQSFVDLDSLAEKLRSASYLLLGEKHDNPDHHLLQLATLRFLQNEDRLAGVTLEMMDEGVRERLIDLPLQTGMSEAELKTYLLWDEEGWDWEFYGPLVELAYAGQIPLAAGNISRERIGQIYADADAGPRDILDAGAIAALTQEIDDSHCGMLPESQFPAMVRVQQARDDTMARNLRRPQDGRVSALIAGNFHIRRDLGVPNYLLRLQPSMPADAVVALSFMEVVAGQTDPRAYQQQGDEAAYDFIWFTPAVSSRDYCASLR